MSDVDTLNKGFGTPLHVGTPVVYFRNQDTSVWFREFPIQKDIWEVTRIINNKVFEIKNITKDKSFATKLEWLIPLSFIASLKPTDATLTTLFLPDSYDWYKKHFTKTPVKDNTSYEFTNSIQKENSMKNIKDVVLNQNVDAAKVAARITAGKTLNTVVKTKVVPQMPMLIRGYADHMLMDVVVANIVSFVVKQFVANNDKAQLAADCMMEAAMVDFAAKFNIEKMVTELLSGVELPTP